MGHKQNNKTERKTLPLDTRYIARDERREEPGKTLRVQYGVSYHISPSSSSSQYQGRRTEESLRK